jgi:hypothetical protein
MTLNEYKVIYAQVSRWALPFLLLLLVFLAFRCNRQGKDNGDINGQLRASLQRTEQLENRNGDLVAQNTVLFTRSQNDFKALTDTVFNLKDKAAKLTKAVLSYSQIVQEANFKGKTATFDDKPTVNEKGDTVYITQPADPDLVRVPRPFSYSDSTIAFAGKVRKSDVLIDSVKIPNVLSLRVITQKTGFLNMGRRTVVQAINSNPAFKNTGIVTMEVKPKASAWSRWIKPALFAGAGIYVGTKLK